MNIYIASNNRDGLKIKEMIINEVKDASVTIFESNQAMYEGSVKSSPDVVFFNLECTYDNSVFLARKITNSNPNTNIIFVS